MTEDNILLEDYNAFASVSLESEDKLGDLLKYIGISDPMLRRKAVRAGMSSNQQVAFKQLLRAITNGLWKREYRMPAGFMAYEELVGYYEKLLQYIVTALMYQGEEVMRPKEPQYFLSAETFRRLMRFEMPFMILDRDTQVLLEYVDSDPISFDELLMPFPAFTIVLPEDGYIPFHYIHPQLEAIVMVQAVTVQRTVIRTKDGHTLALSLNIMHDHMGNGHGPFNYYVTVNKDRLVMAADHPLMKQALAQGEPLQVDDMATMNEEFIGHIIKLLMVMQLKPEMLVEGATGKTSGHGSATKHILNPRRLVLPRMERRYEPPSSDEEAERTRKSPVKHVVRGHTRHNQRHGPGLSLIKKKFIAPYWKCIGNDPEAT